MAVLGLDLGSTAVKAGRFEAGRCVASASRPAPALQGDGEIRECDPEAYRRAAEDAIDELGFAGGAEALGIASQRSSFALWDRRDGALLTSLISWQDRRAAAWCEANPMRRELRERTGLPHSPHYAGPKLASLLAADRSLRERVERGGTLFGTLESWLLWHWSRGVMHRTDPTMASRTMLYDLGTGDWHEDLLGHFSVPRGILPAIHSNAPERVELFGRELRLATIADQQAGALAALGLGAVGAMGAVINFGTGTFVLHAVPGAPRPVLGYLTSPLLVAADRRAHVVEGTINGGGAVADRFAPGPTVWPDRDPHPDSFCIPDDAGLGAPHWRPAARLQLSHPELAPADQRRIVVEGLLFRVREILAGIGAQPASAPIVVSGGLARDPFVAAGLAACLSSPIELAEDRDGTLNGAAVVASGTALSQSSTQPVAPAAELGYLSAKFNRWQEWMRPVL